MVRRWAIVAMVGFVGCESLKTSPAPTEPLPVPVTMTPTPAEHAPLRVAAPHSPVIPVAAIAPQAEPEPVPELPPDPLLLAADCIERGDHAKAAVHLEAHVRVHPEQLMFRIQLAEMLMRVGRDEAAKVHFEQFAADVRRSSGPLKKHLVHVHTRLMEIGQQNGDRFTEVLHRGIGLMLLVEEQDGLADRDADFCEEMLCQAMKALVEAKEMNPSDVQVRLRLAEAYDRMGNRRAADAERTVARTAVTPTGAKPLLTLRE
ncbi:MAG: hypothetical protein K8U57_32905 [Planctomycetes bacterium]|nr:hypothetical protein [Planctomycetota bacterium]